MTRPGDRPPEDPVPEDPVEGPSAAARGALLARVEVITVGVRDFATALWSQGVPCVQVDWAPPGPEDDEMRRLLDRLL